MESDKTLRTGRPAHTSKSPARSDTPPRAPRHDAMPWPALMTMSLAVFIVVSGEMMPTAVLPELAADLDVSLARAGLLVSAWAATVVVASFPLTRLTSRFDRPAIIAASLIVFAVATLVTAAAPAYGVAMGSRLVAAAATGLLWSTINAHAAALAPEGRVGRATAVVLFGGTLGTVGGIPVGNILADLVGWRLPFGALGVLALATAVVVLVMLRRVPAANDRSPDARPAGSRRLLGPVLVVAALGGLVLASHFMAFTFVAEIFAVSSVPTPALLVIFGLVGAGGVALVAAFSDRYPHRVPIAMALTMAVSLAALVDVGRAAALDLTIVVAWGLAVGAAGPAIQATLMHRAGTVHRATAGTLMPVAMNLGIAVGAASGSGVVGRWSVDALPLLSLAPVLLAILGFLVLARAPRRDLEPAADQGPTEKRHPVSRARRPSAVRR